MYKEAGLGRFLTKQRYLTSRSRELGKHKEKMLESLKKIKGERKIRSSNIRSSREELIGKMPTGTRTIVRVASKPVGLTARAVNRAGIGSGAGKAKREAKRLYKRNLREAKIKMKYGVSPTGKGADFTRDSSLKEVADHVSKSTAKEYSKIKPVVDKAVSTTKSYIDKASKNPRIKKALKRITVKNGKKFTKKQIAAAVGGGTALAGAGTAAYLNRELLFGKGENYYG